jgi:hypothetical protein
MWLATMGAPTHGGQAATQVTRTFSGPQKRRRCLGRSTSVIQRSPCVDSCFENFHIIEMPVEEAIPYLGQGNGVDTKLYPGRSFITTFTNIFHRPIEIELGPRERDAILWKEPLSNPFTKPCFTSDKGWNVTTSHLKYRGLDYTDKWQSWVLSERCFDYVKTAWRSRKLTHLEKNHKSATIASWIPDKKQTFNGVKAISNTDRPINW